VRRIDSFVISLMSFVFVAIEPEQKCLIVAMYGNGSDIFTGCLDF
jgi:hypothetical protein